MATIYNSDVTKGLINNAGIATAKENCPNQLADKIVPTFEVNPELLRKSFSTGSARSTSGEATIVTLNSSKDFYLTGFTAGFIKDVACDSATGSYSLYTTNEDGSSCLLCYFPIIALTAQNSMVSVSLDKPIKVKRGSAIGFTGTYAAGVCIRSANIYGYYIDTLNK